MPTENLSGKLREPFSIGPDFIGVGPEKTGTTWLDAQLRAHPDVVLPPVKELRYFWERYNFPDETFWERLNFVNHWHRGVYVKYALERLVAAIANPLASISDRERLVWDFRYIALPHDDRWYLSCFKREPSKISGEISPQHFFLPRSEIERIYGLLPNCKVIITLRKPADWVWSFVKHSTKTGTLQKRYGSVEAFIDKKLRKCSFSKSLDNWRVFYPADRFLVLFYDNLEENPWEYYREACAFLNIVPDESRREDVKKRVNAGKNRAGLPNELLDKVQKGWQDDVQALSAMLPNLPSSWIQ